MNKRALALLFGLLVGSMIAEPHFKGANEFSDGSIVVSIDWDNGFVPARYIVVGEELLVI